MSLPKKIRNCKARSFCHSEGNKPSFSLPAQPLDPYNMIITIELGDKKSENHFGLWLSRCAKDNQFERQNYFKGKTIDMTRKKWAIALTLGYIIAYLFSNGPGILLVNRAELVLGFPPLYLWAVFWGAVQVSILIAAYFLVWKEGEA